MAVALALAASACGGAEAPAAAPTPALAPTAQPAGATAEPTAPAESEQTATPGATAEPTAPAELEQAPTPEATEKPEAAEPAPEATAEPAAADWYFDPTCRQVWRWWDGQAWTGTVGNGGPTLTDPLRDGDLLTAPGAPRECTPVEGWYPDPICRHPWRWWGGQAWTGWAGDGGPRYADPLRPGDTLTAPGDPRECTPAPTAAPTAEVTAEPTVRPTPQVTVEPTVRPTPQVTVEPTPEPTSEPAAADWYPDPTCRADWRWWDGRQWTDTVGNGGPAFTDPLRDGDPITDPGDPRECTPAEVPAGGLTAADLGCEGENALCRIGDDGLAYATRIASHAELVDSGGFHAYAGLNPHTPDVPEDVALGYLTACLRDWGDFAPSRTVYYLFTASPALACNAVWRAVAYPVNHLGVSDIDCVWGSFERLWLRGGVHQATYATAGWAGPPAFPAPSSGRTDGYSGRAQTEPCGSWLDPLPDRGGTRACVEIGRTDGVDIDIDFDFTPNVSGIARDPAWEEWGVAGYLRDSDGNITDEWWKPTYCTWMAKCVDLLRQVAPGSTYGRRHNACDRGGPGYNGLAAQLIFVARRGQCGGLKLLAKIALAWAGGSTLPHVAEVPGDQIINC